MKLSGKVYTFAAICAIWEVFRSDSEPFSALVGVLFVGGFICIDSIDSIAGAFGRHVDCVCSDGRHLRLSMSEKVNFLTPQK